MFCCACMIAEWTRTCTHTSTSTSNVWANERVTNKTTGHDYMLVKCNLIFRNVSLLLVYLAKHTGTGENGLHSNTYERYIRQRQASIYICMSTNTSNFRMSRFAFVHSNFVAIVIGVDVFVASCDYRFNYCCCCCCCCGGCCCHFSFQQDPFKSIYICWFFIGIIEESTLLQTAATTWISVNQYHVCQTHTQMCIRTQLTTDIGTDVRAHTHTPINRIIRYQNESNAIATFIHIEFSLCASYSVWSLSVCCFRHFSKAYNC